MREITAPLYEFEKNLIDDKRAEFEVAKNELDIMKARLEDLKKSYVKARNKTSSNDGTDNGRATGRAAAGIKSEIDDLAAEIAQTGEPAIPTLITSDITEERLVKLAADSGGVIANFSAEGELFANVAGRYSSNSSAFDSILKGYSGDPIRQDRIGRPPQYIDEPRFTVAASVQPIVLKQLAAKPEFRHKGFTARFLYAVPHSRLGYRKVNAEPIQEGVRARYHNGLRRLLHESWNSEGRKTLKLSPDANLLLAKFEEALEPKLRPEGELRPVVDWAAKLCGGLVRIAGLLHLANHAGDDQKPLVVDVVTMSRALAMGEFFISHAKIAYAAMDAADDAEIVKAKRVLGWISENRLVEFSNSECHAALRATFYKAEELRETLRLLADRNYLREKKDTTKRSAGRKHKLWGVNPLINNTIYAKNALPVLPPASTIPGNPTSLRSEVEPIFWDDISRETGGGA